MSRMVDHEPRLRDCARAVPAGTSSQGVLPFHIGRRPFLTARWHSLLVLSYEVAPEILRSFVPRDTELDVYRGKALVSLVGFRFDGARLFGIRVPGHQRFAEVNLRSYVRREVAGELRRGVVFLKEIVPKRMVAWTARWIYGEPFSAAPVRQEVVGRTGPERFDPWRNDLQSPRSIAYHWGRGAAATSAYAELADDAPADDPRSTDAFVVNRSWAYTAKRLGGTREYYVAHRPWRRWRVRTVRVSGELVAWYGPRFASILRGEPSSAVFVDGSEVAVFPGSSL